jgi:hypothetical protein
MLHEEMSNRLLMITGAQYEHVFDITGTTASALWQRLPAAVLSAGGVTDMQGEHYRLVVGNGGLASTDNDELVYTYRRNDAIINCYDVANKTCDTIRLPNVAKISKVFCIGDMRLLVIDAAEGWVAAACVIDTFCIYFVGSILSRSARLAFGQ